jgi:hypothetical protein
MCVFNRCKLSCLYSLYLNPQGHQIWGFVVYRCTYESDDDWDKFMECLKHEIEGTLKLCNGLDMMVSLRITVLEDKSKFDGASDSVIREHFKHWVATAPQEEQGTTAGCSRRYRLVYPTSCSCCS